MQTNKFYTADDVARWESVDKESIDLQLSKLALETRPPLREQRLGMLSVVYAHLGMTCIAKADFRGAIRSFEESVATRCRTFEMIGEGLASSTNVDAGHFQSLLIAFVTRNEPLIQRLALPYCADTGTRGSKYLGAAIKALINGDLDAARTALTQKRPSFEMQFKSYPACLEAIVDQDPIRIVEAVHSASRDWAKWVARGLRGLPDSVCFIQGVGLIRLGERVLGRSIPIINQYLPKELLE